MVQHPQRSDQQNDPGVAAGSEYAAAFRQSPLGMALVGLDRKVIEVNRALCDMLGLPAQDLMRLGMDHLTHPEDADAHSADHQLLLDGTLDSYRLDKRYRHADGHYLWVTVHVGAIRAESGRATMLVSQVQEVTREVRDRRHLYWLAHHDQLTGLGNRELLAANLTADVLARSSGIAVLMVDLDHFKLVNDRHGHLVGDAILVETADRLRTGCRPDDVIVRLGGDEFVIVLLNTGAENGVAGGVAQRIQTLLQAPFHLPDLTLAVTASIGLSVAGDSRTELDIVLHQADIALYRAKADGRNQIAMHQHPDRPVG